MQRSRPSQVAPISRLPTRILLEIWTFFQVTCWHCDFPPVCTEWRQASREVKVESLAYQKAARRDREQGKLYEAEMLLPKREIRIVDALVWPWVPYHVRVMWDEKNIFQKHTRCRREWICTICQLAARCSNCDNESDKGQIVSVVRSPANEGEWWLRCCGSIRTSGLMGSHVWLCSSCIREQAVDSDTPALCAKVLVSPIRVHGVNLSLTSLTRTFPVSSTHYS